MPDFRKGTAALEAAQKQRKEGGGSFRRFAPFISWTDDGDEHYLLFLNQWEDMPQVDYIGFIPQKGEKQDGTEYEYKEAVIARTDPALGEGSDPLVTEWDAEPRTSHVAVAVELEPTFEVINRGGRERKRPSGFAVKTTTFERRIRDDDGEVTDDTEEVTSPVFGFVVQSPHNFFNVIQSYDAGESPIHETPVKVTRIGKKGSNSTSYRVDGYPDQPVDLTGLLDNVEFIGYLGDDAADLVALIADIEDELEAANKVGDYLLDKRMEELCDRERYDRIAAQVDKSLARYNKKGKGKDEEKAKPAARRSQRRKAEPEASDGETPNESPEANAGNEKIAALREKARQRRSGATAAAAS